MFVRLMITCILLFLASSGFAQIYQYTDENGTVHFTDDFSKVPPSQQENVNPIPVIQSPPPENISNTDLQTTSDNMRNDLKIESKELDQAKAELDDIFNLLSEKKVSLQAQAPSENASRDEILSYRDKVLELNAEIESYQEKREQFEKRVEAFNERIKQ